MAARQLPALLVLAFCAVLSAASAPAQSPAPPAAGDVDNGRRRFTAIGCYQCHGREGQGSTQTGGPRLGPPATRLAAFVSYIRRPARSMPPYTDKVTSDAELADIYAFLQTKTVHRSGRFRYSSRSTRAALS